MNDKTSDIADTAPRIAKMVDFRLPLYWLITGAIVVAWAVIGMYFSLQQIKADMQELKSAAAVAVAANGELALLKFRLTSIENEVTQLKSAGKK